MFPYYFCDLPLPSSTPYGPIDTKSFSTREITGKFVLVKFLSNRGRTKSGTDRRTDAQTDIILKTS
jgi:hypothetical protein